MSTQDQLETDGILVEASSVPLLEVQDLAVSYRIPRGILGALKRAPRLSARAVDGVSFALRAGEMVALVGESGCGKTTTAQAVMRLVAADEGVIRFQGRDVTALRAGDLRPLRRSMQLIYQDPYDSLDPRFRVLQTVEEPLLVHALGSPSERRRRVVDALERAGLAPADLYVDRFPHELSGGQRQRVAIAAALVLEPQLLVADEPVSMLDVSVRAEILGLLDGLRRAGGMGILMITHDLSTAAHFADRIAVMYLGRIVEEGPAQSVVRNPQHPYTRALLSVVPKRDPRDRSRPEILRGETPNAVRIPSGCRFHPRCPVAEERCASIDPALHAPEGAAAGHEAACILV